MTTHLLDNNVWHTLAGPHAAFADGQGGARMGFRDHRETVLRVVSRL